MKQGWVMMMKDYLATKCLVVGAKDCWVRNLWHQ
jgi:hypothetical protein